MPTTTLYGKKGGGKSYYGLLKYIRDELVHGDRCIGSTLALKLPELSAYLARKYPTKDIDVNKRIRMLSREEGRRFWLHRQHGVNLPDVTDREYDEGKNPDYSSVAERGGMLYVIDEIHIDFDARAWAKIGRGLTYYNSQERKLLDDQVFITQFLDLVDKRVKNFSQEYVVCRNFRYEKFLTFLSKGSKMHAKHFPYEPRRWSDSCDESHTYSIDPELAACYDTSQGVGFKGAGKPDTARKGRRLPWWIIFAAIAPVWALLYYGTDFASGALAGTAGGKVLANAAGVVPAGTQKQTGGFQSSSNTVPRGESVPRAAREDQAVKRDMPVYVRGVVEARGRAVVHLSDGRMLIEPDLTQPTERWSPDAVVSIERNGVRTHSGEFFWKLIPKSEPRPKDTPAPGREADTPATVSEYKGEALFEPSAALSERKPASSPQPVSRMAGNARERAMRMVPKQ